MLDHPNVPLDNFILIYSASGRQHKNLIIQFYATDYFYIKKSPEISIHAEFPDKYGRGRRT
jgi:hypothetical protein